MLIRKTTLDDMNRIMEIYAYARKFMAEHGNPNQWGPNQWPPEELIRKDIAVGKSYVCVNEEEQVIGTFFFDYGNDIEVTYRVIEDGEWMNPAPFGVVHRLAGDGSQKGIGAFCLNWALSRCGHIKVDTHSDNVVMQNLLEKLGYEKRGIIHVLQDNYPRYAYEKISYIDFDQHFENMMRENELDTVVILGHINPDGDAAGCVMGMAHYLKVNYPQYKVVPHLSVKLDKGPKKQVEKDKDFQPFNLPEVKEGGYAVIVCDTATKARINTWDIYAGAKASLVFDHHASDEGYGDINHTMISEACSENLYHVFDKEKLEKAAREPYPNAADYLFMGMIHDTDCFKRANPQILAAASHLLALGVDHPAVMETKQSMTLEDRVKEASIMKMAERVFDGQVAYVYVDREMKEKEGITYHDIHPISGELRDCEDIMMGFTMFEEEANVWRCSFRSVKSWIDVDQLMRPFGGGGHTGAAGLRKETDQPKKLLADILKAIEETKKVEA